LHPVLDCPWGIAKEFGSISTSASFEDKEDDMEPVHVATFLVMGDFFLNIWNKGLSIWDYYPFHRGNLFYIITPKIT
jgi:hypothetical protein